MIIYGTTSACPSFRKRLHLHPSPNPTAYIYTPDHTATSLPPSPPYSPPPAHHIPPPNPAPPPAPTAYSSTPNKTSSQSLESHTFPQTPRSQHLLASTADPGSLGRSTTRRWMQDSTRHSRRRMLRRVWWVAEGGRWRPRRGCSRRSRRQTSS